jgi:hypothetical protein
VGKYRRDPYWIASADPCNVILNKTCGLGEKVDGQDGKEDGWDGDFHHVGDEIQRSQEREPLFSKLKIVTDTL